MRKSLITENIEICKEKHSIDYFCRVCNKLMCEECKGNHNNCDKKMTVNYQSFLKLLETEIYLQINSTEDIVNNIKEIKQKKLEIVNKFDKDFLLLLKEIKKITEVKKIKFLEEFGEINTELVLDIKKQYLNNLNDLKGDIYAANRENIFNLLLSLKRPEIDNFYYIIEENTNKLKKIDFDKSIFDEFFQINELDKKNETLAETNADGIEIEKKLRDYEDRIAIVTTELERLNMLLETRSNEIELWKNKYIEMEENIKGNKKNEVIMREYENKIAMLTQEIERLNGMFRTRSEEIELWKNKYIEMEENIKGNKKNEVIMREYENRIAMLTQEIERLNSMLRSRSEEIDDWRNRYSELEIMINEYENKIKMLIQEIERLSELLKSRSEEEIE